MYLAEQAPEGTAERTSLYGAHLYISFADTYIGLKRWTSGSWGA